MLPNVPLPANVRDVSPRRSAGVRPYPGCRGAPALSSLAEAIRKAAYTRVLKAATSTVCKQCAASRKAAARQGGSDAAIPISLPTSKSRGSTATSCAAQKQEMSAAARREGLSVRTSSGGQSVSQGADAGPEAQLHTWSKRTNSWKFLWVPGAHLPLRLHQRIASPTSVSSESSKTRNNSDLCIPALTACEASFRSTKHPKKTIFFVSRALCLHDIFFYLYLLAIIHNGLTRQFWGCCGGRS